MTLKSRCRVGEKVNGIQCLTCYDNKRDHWEVSGDELKLPIKSI